MKLKPRFDAVVVYRNGRFKVIARQEVSPKSDTVISINLSSKNIKRTPK